MNQPQDDHELAARLMQAGFETGLSKSGQLLRVHLLNPPDETGYQLLCEVLRCQRLRELGLRDLQGFVNPHIDEISDLPRLRSLDVEGSDITDLSMVRLADCPMLQVVNVRNTPVSRRCVLELRKRMIGTRIIAS